MKGRELSKHKDQLSGQVFKFYSVFPPPMLENVLSFMKE